MIRACRPAPIVIIHAHQVQKNERLMTIFWAKTNKPASVLVRNIEALCSPSAAAVEIYCRKTAPNPADMQKKGFLSLELFICYVLQIAKN